ncbi:MAG TPA: sialidase family protein [Tepidisphaeraceae bacterium]|jgi:hypothetical protein
MPTTTTASSQTTLPGSSRLIFVASEKYPRYSEADVIQLNDNRLLVALGRKQGAEDMSRGTIIGSYSVDGGLSWDDEPHVILEPWGDKTDIYSTSFLRSGAAIHLFFMARGKDPKHDTAVYQITSTDEAKTWSQPLRVSPREGYHVLNNARVVRTSKGRIIVPTAYIEGFIDKEFNKQRIYCTYSDDDGKTWQQSNDLSLENQPLMEPGIAECADGSLFMIIRTAMGKNWQARSTDDGKTWMDLSETRLTSPAAPSTVVRAPRGDDLWLFWCNRGKTNWKGRTNISFAKSSDNGKTWSSPRAIEEDHKRGFGYLSFLIVNDHALVTYYDWRDEGQPNFKNTNLRQRLIPLAWFDGKRTPPVFRKASEPVVKPDRPEEGDLVSMNSGLLADRMPWRLYYNAGALGPTGETLVTRYAESNDLGVTWTKPEQNLVLPKSADDRANYYHASVHPSGEGLIAYVWSYSKKADDSALYRYVSPDRKTFTREPETPMFASRWTNATLKEAAGGEGKISNDAFDVVQNADGTWSYYAAVLEKAADKRAVFKEDNLPGLVRILGRATSSDGAGFGPIEVVLRPDYDQRQEFDQQFYGMTVFTYRKFYLGLLHTFYLDSQIIQPEWCWSHDGASWARTRTPAIPLGDEGKFDSRMIVFGSLKMIAGELVYLYSGNSWRHNAFKRGRVKSAIGRATIALSELDAWLETLPQP